MARTVSLSLTFDQSNVDALRERFLTVECPIILLGLLAGESVVPDEIPDP